MYRNTRDLVSGRGYGFFTWADLFTDRQLVALTTFNDLVHEARAAIKRDALVADLSAGPTPLRDGGSGAKAYAEAVSVYLAFGISKLVNLGSSITSWMSDRGALRETFARQAIPMVWDFAEVNVFSNSGGNWSTPIDKIGMALANLPANSHDSIRQIDAGGITYSPNTLISTNPPYYDNIGYADLSDFFYVWMKPLIRRVYPDLFGVLATPKAEDLIASPYRHGDREAAKSFFLDGMSKALANMVRQSSPDCPATVYYAFKQSEIAWEGVSSTGWATFLKAVLEAGYAVVGTWPVRTESPGRIIATGTNALASSVVLVCRKREGSAETISSAEFIHALKRELPPAIEELQKANISPADMPQSAIGPGMAVFSRCKAVLEADDSPMTVKTALQLINREIDEYLGGIQGEFDAETRFAFTWFEQHGLAAGDYGTANSLATAHGISVDSVKHAGIMQSAVGKVRILKRDEIDAGWEPEQDAHLTVWECCQHLVRALEQDGEAAAYNGLIAVWPELTRHAAAIHDTRGDLQAALEL